MQPLELPDTHHLSAAVGWLELGNPVEANEEIEKIPANLHAHPAVLQVRYGIHEAVGNWIACFDMANALVGMTPDDPTGWIYRSFALHEMERTQEALDELLPAADKFPSEWGIRYNLACYTCRLGKLADARQWLKQAIELGEGPQVKLMALEDPDLQSIRIG